MADHKPYADSKQQRDGDEAFQGRFDKPRKPTGICQDSPERIARFAAYRATRQLVSLKDRIAAVIDSRRILKSDV